LGSGVSLWAPDQDVRHKPLFSLPGWPLVRCNEGGVDPLGAMWMGSMLNNVKSDGEPSESGGRDGVLYRINGNGDFSEWRRDHGISNTILWSPDHSEFYFGDTLKNQIWLCDYDLADGSIGNQRSFFEGFGRGLPDGSTVDSEGYVWNCRYGGGCIVRVSPDGTVDRVVEMPVSNLTNCTFGGTDGNILFVTSASPDSTRWERFGGCLFAIETNISGVPSNEFRCF
jgi:sugar lactone lactonase YvrE